MNKGADFYCTVSLAGEVNVRKANKCLASTLPGCFPTSRQLSRKLTVGHLPRVLGLVPDSLPVHRRAAIWHLSRCSCFSGCLLSAGELPFPHADCQTDRLAGSTISFNWFFCFCFCDFCDSITKHRFRCNSVNAPRHNSHKLPWSQET